MVRKGRHTTGNTHKATVLLASDEEKERQSERAISDAYHLSVRSVERIRPPTFL